MPTAICFLFPLILFGFSLGVRGEELKAATCFPGAADVLFVVENSDSVGRINFEKVKTAAAALSLQLDIGPRNDESHVGFVSFNGKGFVEFGISDYLANGIIEKAIMRSVFRGGSCNIADGLQYAIEQVFNQTTSSDSSRKQIPKVIILVTDGKESSDPNAVRTTAQRNKISILAVGVGQGINKAELVQFTGEAHRVFTADSFDTLLPAFSSVCQFVEGSIAPRPPANAARQCPCTLERLWLDIIFVLDASDAIGVQDFKTVKSFIGGLIESITISQEKGPYTRVAFVTATSEAKGYGDLRTYKSNDEAMDALKKVSFVGGSHVNIASALIEAKNIIDSSDDRRSTQKLVVYIGAIGFDCDAERQRAILVKRAAMDDPCRISEQMKSSGIILMTIAMKLAGLELPPRMDFGSKCFSLTNNIDMAENFISQICKANCHCVNPLTQFIGDDECDEFGECLYKQTIPTGFFSARIACNMEHQSLADIFDQKKQRFLNAMASEGNSFPYWIGMKRGKDGAFTWDFEAKKAVRGDYSEWLKGEENTVKGCAAVTSNEGTEGWQGEECSWDEPSAFYFCQQKTCDTDNYCE